MVYNSFQTSILTRIILLVSNLMALSYLVIRQERFFTLVFLALLALLQIVLLFLYLNRTNRNLARFLLLLTHEDTSVVHWKGRVEKTFQGLHHSFRKVNDEINRIRLEKEKGSILLEGIIQHMETGIIVIEDGGKVEVVNDAALQTLGVNRLEHLDELDVIQMGLAAKLSEIRYESGNVLALERTGLMVSHVLARISLLKLEERTLKIISIQDIGSQLEANEIESWQKMTRVLSHEISNSVTPISTLGDGIQMKLKQGRSDQDGRLIIDNDAARDLLQSSKLIQQRSNALVEFMEHYKNFSRLPDPVPGKLVVSAFFEGLELLFREDLNKAGIRMVIFVEDPSVAILGDQKLIEQAYINLVRNSMEALKGKDDGKIEITVGQPDNRRVSLEFFDNGPGIPEEILPQVFTPFFTTRSGGTGIGLTLVRKIVVLSGGSISIDSAPGRGTAVKLRLPLFMVH